ncbi:MAG: hypothetical protein ACYDHH_09420 [Solirubrobacteraceae bacterium]
MLRFFSGKTAIAPLSAVAVLAVAGVAVAYFTTTGSGTGQASVGSPTPWSVTFGATSGTMYPGAGTSTVHYTVTNSGGGHQNVNGTSASVVDDGAGNIKDNGTSVPGCLTSWFTVTNNQPAAVDLAPGGQTTGSADVAMSDASTSQNSCQGHHPDILVNVN